LRKRLKSKLSGKMSAEELSRVYSAFDTVGDIAIIKTSKLQNPEVVAQKIQSIHHKVKSVYSPMSRIEGDFRTRNLTLLAGEDNTVTGHRESGCVFWVDVEKCYFSPRLSHERKRVAGSVGPGETVVNMFAGVGCFSILIAKTASKAKVYSIDVNPAAYEYMKKNVRVNRVISRVLPMLGDAKTIIQTQLQGVADRVLMPLPEKALPYLPAAVSALKKEGGYIHYYDFQHATAEDDPVEKTKQKVAPCLDGLGVNYNFVFGRIVRSTGPNWWQTVLDIRVGSLPSKF
jgi:tRNA (guanine37-N1)-methyltransferase